MKAGIYTPHRTLPSGNLAAMLMFTIAVVTGSSVVTGNSVANSGVPLPAPIAGQENWSLTFADEFDYPDADLDKNWISQNGPSGHILCSRWRENAKVENGTLKLINRKEDRGGQAWTSGNIWTRQWFQYGYFECRYRYAAAPATNNSFWIMTDLSKRENRPPKGAAFEIDINEGHFPGTVNTNIHNWSDLVEVNGKKRSQSSSKSFNYAQQPAFTAQLEIPITAKRIRFTSDHPKQFHLRELRVYGVKPEGGYPEVTAPAPSGAPKDFAHDPANVVVVSGNFVDPATQSMPGRAANLFDNDPTTSWVAQPDGTKFVEIEFPQAKTIGCIQLLKGWKDKSGGWQGMIDQFKLQYHNGTEWVDISSFHVADSAVNFARDFNTFGLLWSEKELVFYFNDTEIRRVPNAFCHSPAPVWLSLAIIAWHGKVTDAIDGTFMEVDYVRIWQQR